MKKISQKAAVLLALTLMLTGCGETPAPVDTQETPTTQTTTSATTTTTTTTTPTETTTVSTTITKPDLCSLLPEATVHGLMNEDFTAAKNASLGSDVANCTFTGKTHPLRSLSVIIQYQDSTDTAKSSFDTSKQMELKTLDPNIFKTMEVANYGNDGFAWHSRVIAQMIAYKNSKYVVTTASGFETPEKALANTQALMKNYLDKI